MKHLLFLFAVLFTVSACDGPVNFTSLANKPPENTKKPSQGDPQQQIQGAVKEKMRTQTKIGGKERKTVNIPETVSEKNLGKKRSIVTNVDVTSVIVEGKQQKEAKKVEKKRAKERVVKKVVKKKAAPPEKKLDILFI